MAKIDQLKRDLLHGAVSDNVDRVHNRLPRRMRPSHRRLRSTLRVLVLLIVPIGLLGIALWLSQINQGLAVPVAADEVYRPELTLASAQAEAATEAVLERMRFNAPISVDPSVFTLPVRTVVIDAGHGGLNPGTRLGELQEKDITLDIAQRLRDRLVKEAGLKVKMTRSGDETVTLSERVEIANSVQGDLFLSIHVNWIEMREVRGVETYFLGPTDDPYLTELTKAENVDSGYSLSDFRHLLEGMYANVRDEQSRAFAHSVQSSMHSSLVEVNPDLENRGVKKAPFVVLIGTEMPAILAEVSCLSNEEEAELLKKPRYRQYIADALFTGIHSYVQSPTLSAEKGS